MYHAVGLKDSLMFRVSVGLKDSLMFVVLEGLKDSVMSRVSVDWIGGPN